MSTLKEMAHEYKVAAAKLAMAIERHKTAGNLTPAELNSLQQALRDTRDAASADYVAKTRRAWRTVAPAITPRFQICGNPGARHGQLDPDQHGYLFQALQKRYEGIRLKHHGHENNWAHPIARWLVKAFQTMTKPFTYWSEKGG